MSFLGKECDKSSPQSNNRYPEAYDTHQIAEQDEESAARATLARNNRHNKANQGSAKCTYAELENGIHAKDSTLFRPAPVA